jgi:hypothetical protein
LARIRKKIKEGALERLADRPGAKRKTVSQDTYEAMKLSCLAVMGLTVKIQFLKGKVLSDILSRNLSRQVFLLTASFTNRAMRI